MRATILKELHSAGTNGISIIELAHRLHVERRLVERELELFCQLDLAERRRGRAWVNGLRPASRQVGLRGRM